MDDETLYGGEESDEDDNNNNNGFESDEEANNNGSEAGDINNNNNNIDGDGLGDMEDVQIGPMPDIWNGIEELEEIGVNDGMELEEGGGEQGIPEEFDSDVTIELNSDEEREDDSDCSVETILEHRVRKRKWNYKVCHKNLIIG